MKNYPRGDVFYHRILRWPVLFALAFVMLTATIASAATDTSGQKGPIISTGNNGNRH